MDGEGDGWLARVGNARRKGRWHGESWLEVGIWVFGYSSADAKFGGFFWGFFFRFFNVHQELLRGSPDAPVVEGTLS